MGSTRPGVSMTSAPTGPRWTTRGAATITRASWPATIVGAPLSIACEAAASSAGHDGGGVPALAIGTRRPAVSWKTTERSASVVSTAA